jgi:hypothetical protein
VPIAPTGSGIYDEEDEHKQLIQENEDYYSNEYRSERGY